MLFTAGTVTNTVATIRFSIIIHIGNGTDAAAMLSRIKVGVLNFHQEVVQQYYGQKDNWSLMVQAG